jgi:hypothetical protein
MPELLLGAGQRRRRATRVRHVEREDARPLRDGDEAQLEDARRSVGVREFVLQPEMDAFLHAAPEDGEHGCRGDAREALFHRSPEELLSRAVGLRHDRVVDEQVRPVEPDHLAAFEKALEHVTSNEPLGGRFAIRGRHAEGVPARE